MRALRSVVLKRELLRKARLSVFKSMFFPIFTYGHESWIMTKRVQSQMQAYEMRFLWKIKVVTMFDKLRNSSRYGSKALSLDGLALQVECLKKERLPKQILLAKMNGKRPV